jgi:hypothetical protein
MCPALNFSGHLICLSGVVRARKPPLPDGITSPARDHRGGVADLALRCLQSSMMLWRSSRSWPLSRNWRFRVIRHCASLSARRRLPLTEDAIHFGLALPHLIVRLVINRRLSSRVAGRSLYYDVVCCLSPLLCQSNKGRAFRCHALN